VISALTRDAALAESFVGKVVASIEVPPSGKDGAAAQLVIRFTDGSFIRARPTSLAPLIVLGGKA
jgi:hypothetical protein